MQAFSRAAVRFGEPRYFEAARAGLGVFREAPPGGVRVAHGRRRALPHLLLRARTAGAQRLHAGGQRPARLRALANDAEGKALFAAGEAQLRGELGAYDTGAWSRYSLQREADVGYHKLARDFLANLCKRLSRTPRARPAAARRARRPPAGGAVPAAGARSGAGAAAPSRRCSDPTPYCAAGDALLELPAPAAGRGARVAPRARRQARGAEAGAVQAGERQARRRARRPDGHGAGRAAGQRAADARLDAPALGGQYRILLHANDIAGKVGSARGELERPQAPRKSAER